MSRQAIIRQITERLYPVGISCQVGQGSDITITAEFTDAAWNSSTNKIAYEAAVLVDEQNSTVFMWEKTVDIGSRFTGGFSGESSFQSGTTFFRKVKHVQYGPDGKTYELALDLGLIAKTIKEAAKAYDWSFRTVLSREKAIYSAENPPPAAQPAADRPSAASPVATRVPAARPAAAQPAAPKSPGAAITGRFCIHCGHALSPDMRFCSACGKQRQA